MAAWRHPCEEHVAQGPPAIRPSRGRRSLRGATRRTALPEASRTAAVSPTPSVPATPRTPLPSSARPCHRAHGRFPLARIWAIVAPGRGRSADLHAEPRRPPGERGGADATHPQEVFGARERPRFGDAPRQHGADPRQRLELGERSLIDPDRLREGDEGLRWHALSHRGRPGPDDRIPAAQWGRAVVACDFFVAPDESVDHHDALAVTRGTDRRFWAPERQREGRGADEQREGAPRPLTSGRPPT